MGRKALRRRRKPRPPRRRHPQRTLRIRHGFASFGRYYFAPEKKINTKKVWILSGDKSFFSLEGGSGLGVGSQGNAEQMRPEASRSPRPGLVRGRGPPPRFLAPGSRRATYTSQRPYSRVLPQYWDLAQNSSFLATEGSLSPGIATLHELFGAGGGWGWRLACLCPRRHDLRLGSFRWVFGPQRP